MFDIRCAKCGLYICDHSDKLAAAIESSKSAKHLANEFCQEMIKNLRRNVAEEKRREEARKH